MYFFEMESAKIEDQAQAGSNAHITDGLNTNKKLREAIEEDHDSISSITGEKTPGNSNSGPTTPLQVKKVQLPQGLVSLEISENNDKHETNQEINENLGISRPSSEKSIKKASDYYQVDERHLPDQGNKEEAIKEGQPIEEFKDISNLKHQTEKAEDELLSENNSSQMARDKLTLGLSSQKEGLRSIFSNVTPNFGSDPYIVKKGDDISRKQSESEHHEKMMNKKVYNLEVSLTDLQQELSTKDRQIAFLKNKLKVISFGEMESPKFQSRNIDMMASVEEVSELRNPNISELLQKIKVKDAEIEQMRAKLSHKEAADDVQCDLVSELASKNALLEQNAVKLDNDISTLKDLVEKLKAEKQVDRQKLDDEAGVHMVVSDTHNRVIKELTAELESLKLTLKGQDRIPSNDKLSSVVNNSHAIFLHQDSDSKVNNIKVENMLADDVSRELELPVSDIKDSLNSIADLKDKLKKCEARVETLRAELKDQGSVFKDKEKLLRKEFSDLKEKHLKTVNLLAQNRVDKENLLELLTDYESTMSQEEASRSSPAKELDRAAQTIKGLEKEHDLLKTKLEKIEEQKRKQDLELFTLKTGPSKLSNDESLKIKQLEVTVKEKSDEIHSLNYRLHSVFDLVKKKQEDEESTTQSIKSAVDKIKNTLEIDNEHRQSPQSFGRENIIPVKDNLPASFFSNKSKSNVDFDHKELVQLNSELNTVVIDLIVRYNSLKLSHAEVNQQMNQMEKQLQEESEKRLSAEKQFRDLRLHAVSCEKDSNSKLLEVEKEKGRYLEELIEKDRQSDDLPRLRSFQESLHKIDFLVPDESSAVGFSVVSLDALEVSSPGRGSPNFGVNIKKSDLLKLQKVNSGSTNNAENQILQFEETTEEKPISEANANQDLISKLTVEVMDLKALNQIQTQTINELKEVVKALEETIATTKPQTIPEPQPECPPHIEKLNINEPLNSATSVHSNNDHHDSLEMPDARNRIDDHLNPNDISAMTYEDVSDYDWRTALWKCYFSSVNNECDEKSEHLKIVEIAPHVIDNINILHRRVSELEDSNKQMADSIARKDKRMDKLVDETNQAEDIIKELVVKCDKLEIELANRDKAEGEDIKEMTVSDLLETIESANKSPMKPDSHIEHSVKDRDNDIQELNDQIAALERTKRAQGRILDSLIKEIVAYQSILKADQDQDASVELALKVLDKILKVLDAPAIEEAPEHLEYDSQSHKSLARKASQKNLNDQVDDNPNYILTEMPTFGGPNQPAVDPLNSKDFFEKKINANSASKPAENRERAKSIKQIRDEVEAQKARISQLSENMSSKRHTAKKSNDGSVDNFSSRKLTPIFEATAPKRNSLERQYGSESNAQRVESKLDFDSVEPHQLGQCQIFFKKTTPKKLQPYPDQVSARSSSDDKRDSRDISNRKIKSKLETMNETIHQLKEKIDQNLVKIRLQEENETSMKKELDSKKKEIKDLKAQINIKDRDKSSSIIEKPKPDIKREASKSTLKPQKSETKPLDKKKQINIATGRDKWSIALGSKAAGDRPRVKQISSVSPIRRISKPHPQIEISSDDHSMHIPSKRSINDTSQVDKSLQIEPKIQKIEKGLATVQVKLMELINRNQGDKDEENIDIHRDMTTCISSTILRLDKLINECKDGKDQLNLRDSTETSSLDLITQISQKGLELGDEYIQLDEAAVTLAKLQGANRARNPALSKIKDFIKCSESDKAKLLSDQLSKGPKIVKEKLANMTLKTAETFKKDYSALHSMVSSRKFKLSQICTAFNETLDNILSQS